MNVDVAIAEAERLFASYGFGVRATVSIDPEHALTFGKHARAWRLLIETANEADQFRVKPLSEVPTGLRVRACHELRALFDALVAEASAEAAIIELVCDRASEFLDTLDAARWPR